MKKTLLALLLLSNLSFAFTFDIWESKITLDHAIQIAKRNNIPLKKEGIIATGKEFKKEYLYLDKYPDNRIFQYNTTLLDALATVTLYFTQESKKLYNVKIRWSKQNQEFTDPFYELLDKKYGERKTIVSSNLGDLILAKRRQWQPDKETLIQSKISLSGTELLYIDVIETQKEEEKKEEEKNEKKEQALIKDSDKF